MDYHHEKPEWREGGGGEKDLLTAHQHEVYSTKKLGMCLFVAWKSVQKHDWSWMAFQETGPNTQKAQNSNNKIQKIDVKCNLCEIFLFLLFEKRCLNNNAFAWLLEQSWEKNSWLFFLSFSYCLFCWLITLSTDVHNFFNAICVRLMQINLLGLICVYVCM